MTANVPSDLQMQSKNKPLSFEHNNVFNQRLHVFFEHPYVFNQRPHVFFERPCVFFEHPRVFFERPYVFNQRLHVFNCGEINGNLCDRLFPG